MINQDELLVAINSHRQQKIATATLDTIDINMDNETKIQNDVALFEKQLLLDIRKHAMADLRHRQNKEWQQLLEEEKHSIYSNNLNNSMKLLLIERYVKSNNIDKLMSTRNLLADNILLELMHLLNDSDNCPKITSQKLIEILSTLINDEHAKAMQEKKIRLDNIRLAMQKKHEIQLQNEEYSASFVADIANRFNKITKALTASKRKYVPIERQASASPDSQFASNFSDITLVSDSEIPPNSGQELGNNLFSQTYVNQAAQVSMVSLSSYGNAQFCSPSKIVTSGQHSHLSDTGSARKKQKNLFS